ncbi:anti-sigma factor domain-containing protein [Pseudooceanicola sp.]|uniref:anti-sigma factor n=1 Tax=Pseudooceanicola sp. TaxID=1914328 RepID=UPI0035C68853
MSDADTIGDDDDRILAAEYVLGLLTDDDRRRVDDRLGGDPALRAEVALWEESFVALTDPIPEVTPPERLWRAITSALDTPVVTAPKRRGFGILGYALGGVLAAGLAWVVISSGIMTPAAPEYQARIAAEDNAVVFAAAFDEDTGQLALEYQAGAHAPDRSFEFWLIADGEAPVSVIVWPDGSQAEVVTLPADLAAKIPGAVLAISDEPAGGSPTGQPTGDVLAVGPVQEI